MTAATSTISFVNHREFLNDILAWEPSLPEVDAFVGVPRSGVLPAATLALRRNVKLLSYEEFLRDPHRCLDETQLRRWNPAFDALRRSSGRVMVVDDCVGTGRSLRAVRRRLSGASIDVVYGAVYCARRRPPFALSFRQIPKPRLWEWNFFRHPAMQRTVWDMDGALCADWIARTERRQVAAYERHVREAAPRFLPQYPIYAVATNRLPRWRELTEEWLERHGVRYGRLLMSPCESCEERNTLDRPRGTLKGRLFRESDAAFFVESDSRQARVIAEIAGKPTLALDRMKMFG